MLNYDMPQNLRALIIFAVITFFVPNFLNGQSKFSMDIYGTPFIQKFGKTITEKAYLDHPNITTEYIFNPSQEAGIMFNHFFENKFGWTVGTSWYNDTRSLRFMCFEDSLHSMPIFNFAKDIKIQRVGLRLGFNYRLTQKLQLDFILSTHFNVYTKFIPEWNVNVGILHQAYQTSLDFSIHENKAIYEPQIIPELRFSGELYKGLRFHFGTRLKFWGPYYMYTEVKGSFESTAYSDEVLYRSFMSGGSMSYFAGITYRLGLVKN
ncbi:MAG: hypothetical protein H6582_01000 [Crocinitomicaceae bacterium]|nr:hypothetical protein [Crocinitomicaceae bacterium]